MHGTAQDTATLREWLDGAEAAAAVDEGDEQEGEEEEAPAPDRQTYERMSLSDIRKLRVRGGEQGGGVEIRVLEGLADRLSGSH